MANPLIFHVDVNSAFLSWESADRLKKNPAAQDLRLINAVIGGDEEMRHGVVLAKSPSAKKYGIMTGEPLAQARKKCPNLVIAPPNHALYVDYSKKFIHILEEVAPKIEQCSIDEAFCDMTGTGALYGDPVIFANKLKDRIYRELGFTVNIGISTNKLLAKMASDFEKPNKIHTLYPKEIQDKMWPLPVGELFMLGRKSVPKLYNMHIKTIGDLAKANINELTNKFGKHGKMMWEYANGIDESEVIYNYGPPKSIGNSTTLAKDVSNVETLNEILLTLAEHVAYRLRKYKMVANVVNVGLRTKDFKDFSHQKKLDFATANTKDIYLKAKELLKEMYNGEEIRLVALRVDKLTNKNEAQISLFETEKERKQEKLDEVLDNLKEKYGYEKITRSGKMGIEKNIKLK